MIKLKMDKDYTRSEEIGQAVYYQCCLLLDGNYGIAIFLDSSEISKAEARMLENDMQGAKMKVSNIDDKVTYDPKVIGGKIVLQSNGHVLEIPNTHLRWSILSDYFSEIRLT